MFFRMLKGALFRQKSKMIMIAITIALGASLATAMLNIMFDVGDKMNQELKTYGANITVVPKASSVLNGLYEMDERKSLPLISRKRSSARSKRSSGRSISSTFHPSSIPPRRWIPVLRSRPSAHGIITIWRFRQAKNSTRA